MQEGWVPMRGMGREVFILAGTSSAHLPFGWVPVSLKGV